MTPVCADGELLFQDIQSEGESAQNEREAWSGWVKALGYNIETNKSDKFKIIEFKAESICYWECLKKRKNFVIKLVLFY